MNHKKVMKLATEGKRLGAFCIDAVIPFIAGCIMMVAIIAISLTVSSSPYSSFGYGYGYGYGYNYGYGRVSSGGIAAAFFVSLLLLIAYMVAQIVFFTKAKTMGKAILGLQVVSSDNGEPIGFWKMLFREWFVKRASGYIFGIGYIWVIVDDKNRGWHDKILDTYVVDLKESAALSASKRSTAPRHAAPAAPVNPAPVRPVTPVAPAAPVQPTPAAPVSSAPSAQSLSPAAPAPETPLSPAGPDVQPAADTPSAAATVRTDAHREPAVPEVPAAGTVLEAPEEKIALPVSEKPVLISEPDITFEPVTASDAEPEPESAPETVSDTEAEPDSATLPE